MDSDTHQQQEQEHPLPIQLQPPQNRQLHFSLPSLFPGFPRLLFLTLGISVFALIQYGSAFSHTLQEMYKSNHDYIENNKESVVLHLHRKCGIREVLQRDAQFKLGRSVDLNRENGGIIGQHKSKINKKLVSSNAPAVADSSSIFPVIGNIYPNRLVGNPPRPYYLDVNTGSDLTRIQYEVPCVSCAEVKEVSRMGLVQDASDPTLPTCWRAEFPITIKSLYCEELVRQEHSNRQRCGTEEQIMSASPEKHPSLCEPDYKPEILKSHEYQYEATQARHAGHRRSGWAFREGSERMEATLISSQIQQNNQRPPTCPSQLGSNPWQRKARSWWRQIKKYFCLSCKRN